MFRTLLLGLSIVMALPAQERAITVVPNGERRVALLVGNDRYSESPLKNAVNDARAMGAALQDLGFEVTVATDADRRSFDGAIGTFIRKLGVGSVGFFFYAGHGVQMEGENYLLPVDFKATSEEEARYSGIPIGLVHDRMLKSGARLCMVVLDACRDNPFRTSRGTSRGLAPMNAGKGSFLAFATAPGQTASDVGTTQGGNGLFTGSLLEVLRQPDLDLEDVFKRTRERVVTKSQERQIPWTSSSVVGTFVFRDLASQERRVAEEKTKLEAELAKLQADKAANLLRLGAAETQKREQALQEQLRLKELEEKRLADEGDRRHRLQADAAQLDEASKAQTAQREQQRQAEEGRLAELKRKLETERISLGSTTNISLVQARAEVASLTKKKAEVAQRIQTEQIKALATLDADFRALAQKLPIPTPRDEFETTAKYQARLAEHAKAKANLELRMRQEREGLKARYDNAAAEQSTPYTQQIEMLSARKYPIPFSVELGRYDPDSERYALLLRPISGPGSSVYRASLKLAPEDARSLKARASSLKAEGEGGLEARASQVAVLDLSLGRLAVHGFQKEGPPPDYRQNQLGMNFAEIPAGNFTMGGSGNDEQPRHKVNLPGFWMGTTTVTQAQWRAVLGDAPSKFTGDNLPVEQVSWDDVQRFIAALNDKEADRSYRLPSEAEWEYACRAGSTGETYGELNANAWYGSNSGSTTQAVGQKRANAFGLYDMLGNVWQWCADPWHDSYHGAPTDGTVWLGSGSPYVTRGGCWDNNEVSLHFSIRGRFGSTFRYLAIGFRLVCVPLVAE